MKKLLCLLLAMLLLSGCATIMQGTKQNVGISSIPTGASVAIDNAPYGKTPIVANLARKDNHFIEITMSGYLPYATTLSRQTSGWVWGNLAFGGLIGLAVDAISGGLYRLTPEQITAELKKEGTAFLPKEDMVYIVTVLKPNPAWQKIGNLEAE